MTVSEWGERVVVESFPWRSVYVGGGVWLLGLVLLVVFPLPSTGLLKVFHLLAAVIFFGAAGASFVGAAEGFEARIGDKLPTGGVKGELRVHTSPLLARLMGESALGELLGSGPPRVYVQSLAGVSAVRVDAKAADIHYGQRGGFRIVAVLEGGIVLPLIHEFHMIPVGPFNDLVDALAVAFNLTLADHREIGHDASPNERHVLRGTLHGWRRLSPSQILEHAMDEHGY